MLDTVLDRTIALGYGDVGFEVRRRLPGWPDDPPRMDGRVVLITGAATGIGLAAAQGFARLGASVRAAGRNEARAEDAVAAIRRAVPGADARPVACDVSSLADVCSFAERLRLNEPRLDVVVNNAGVMPDRRRRSREGHELMFATHVLGPFALTAMLAGLLERSAPARVINVSSGGMYTQRLPADDLESERTAYRPEKLYARTKREQLIITEQWAARLEGSGVVVHAMHPGWVDTPGVQQALPGFRRLTRPILRSLEEGADTIVWLGGAAEPLESTGRFWQDRRPRPTHYLLGASDDSPADREKLWHYCETLVDAFSAEAPR